MTEIKYEITMYQLLIIFVISIFVAVLLGSWIGGNSGFDKGVNSVRVEKPSYCGVDRVDGKIVIKCNELEGVTAEEFCKVISPVLGKKVKILVTG